VDDARHWPAVLERDSSHFFQNFEKTSCALLNLGMRDQFAREAIIFFGGQLENFNARDWGRIRSAMVSKKGGSEDPPWFCAFA
jgi:hypothetical protein